MRQILAKAAKLNCRTLKIKDNLQYSQIQASLILQHLLLPIWTDLSKEFFLVALNCFAMVHQIFRFITAEPSFSGHQTP